VEAPEINIDQLVQEYRRGQRVARRRVVTGAGLGTENWRGKPLVSHEVIVNLLGNTTTQKGLKIRAELDRQAYPTGIKIAEADLAELMIEKSEFHGEWNYRISPRPK